MAKARWEVFVALTSLMAKARWEVFVALTFVDALLKFLSRYCSQFLREQRKLLQSLNG